MINNLKYRTLYVIGKIKQIKRAKLVANIFKLAEFIRTHTLQIYYLQFIVKKTKIRLSGHTTPTFLNSCSWVELRNGHPALERACTPSLLQAPALACCSPHGCQESGMTLQLSDNQGSLLLHQVTSPNDWPQSYGFDPTSPSAPYLHPLTK